MDWNLLLDISLSRGANIHQLTYWANVDTRSDYESLMINNTDLKINHSFDLYQEIDVKFTASFLNSKKHLLKNFICA